MSFQVCRLNEALAAECALMFVSGPWAGRQMWILKSTMGIVSVNAWKDNSQTGSVLPLIVFILIANLQI